MIDVPLSSSIDGELSQLSNTVRCKSFSFRGPSPWNFVAGPPPLNPPFPPGLFHSHTLWRWDSHANRVKLTRHSRYQAMWCDFRDTRRDLCLNILLLASNAWILLRHKDFHSMMNVQAEHVSVSIRRDFTLPNLGWSVYLSVMLMGRGDRYDVRLGVACEVA